MKLSQCRPCDNCRGQINPIFYRLQISQAMFTPSANRVLGMIQFMAGNVELGEMFSGEENDAILVMGEKDPRLMIDLFICQKCFLGGPIDLAVLWERRNNELSAAIEKSENRKET